MVVVVGVGLGMWLWLGVGLGSCQWRCWAHPRRFGPNQNSDPIFFLFNHYSHAIWTDHGEIMYSPFPARCPRGGGTLHPFALRPGLSQESEMRTKENCK